VAGCHADTQDDLEELTKFVVKTRSHGQNTRTSLFNVIVKTQPIRLFGVVINSSESPHTPKKHRR